MIIKNNISPITQGLFQLVSHYACIVQTPLYHLFHQRIKSCADQIKLTLILKQTGLQLFSSLYKLLDLFYI